MKRTFSGTESRDMLFDQPSKMQVTPGTRRLQDMSLYGRPVQDPHRQGVVWYITYLYQPLMSRAIQGVRARLVTQPAGGPSYITFCNQRDLEVLLGVARPGDYCRWLGRNYQAPSSDSWYGLSADVEDLRDDLFEYELHLRHHLQSQGYGHIPDNAQIHYTRYVVEDKDQYSEQEWLFLRDRDPNTGATPDLSFSGLMRRWTLHRRAVIR